MNESELREYIINNIDESYFIKAGAGAGKTYLIVKRIINQLASGFKPFEIVVITFTEKASQELLQRIFEEVNSTYEKEEDLKKKENLKYAKDNIDAMQISTIHAFCNKLISEQIFSIKFPMGTKLLIDNELDKKLCLFFNNNYMNYRDKIELAEDIWNGDVKEKTYEMFKDVLYLSDDTILAYDKSLLNDDISNLLENAYKEFYKGLLDILNSYNLNNFIDFDDKDAKTVLYKNVFDAYDNKNYEDLYKITKKEEAKFFKSSKLKLINKDDLSDANNRALELALKFNEVAYLINPRKVACIVDIVNDLRNDFIKSDFKNSFLTNDDLLNVACKLVFEKEAYDFFSKKYKCFYVDEFQDTDHVQTKMILKLCSKSFEDDSLVPGKLTVVGDYKQSIYRFRGADIEEYERVEEIFRKQNNEKIRTIDLTFNFRSSKKIIDYVNNNFCDYIKNYIPMEYSLLEKRNEAILKNNYNKEKVIEGVYYLEGIIDNPKDLIEYDIRNISDYIKSLVGKYYIFDKKDRVYRFIKYSDFLLLSENTTRMTIYVKALMERGIPISLAGKINVKENNELNRFIRLFDYLTIKDDDEVIKEAIRQEFLFDLVNKYDFKEEDLLKLKEENKYDGYALLMYLLNHFEYFLDKGNIKREEIVSIESKIIQAVEYVILNNEDNSIVLKDALYEYLDFEIKKELSLNDENDAVRFMNVHQSKGLEGKIVMIVDRRSTSDRVSPLRLKENDKYYYWPIVKTAMASAIASYSNDENLVNKAKKDSDEEMIRLEYTAITRAEEALIVLGGMEDSFVSSYRKDIDYCSSENIINFVVDEEKERTYIPFKVNDDYLLNDNQLLNVYEDISPSDKEIHDEKKEFKDLDRPKGTIFGTIMHRCFEFVVNDILANKDIDILNIINRAVLESYEDVSLYKNYLIKIVNDFKDGEVVQLVKKADKVYTELPFYIYENNEYIHGFIDLLLVVKDKFIIVDYKSDALYKDETNEEFKKRLDRQYKGQLALYKKAVSSLFKISDDRIETIIYSIEGK